MSDRLFRTIYLLAAMSTLVLTGALSVAAQGKRPPVAVPMLPYTLTAQEIKTKTDQLAQQYLSAGGVGVTVGIIDGDKQLFYSYGVTEKGGGQKPTSKTLFQIGSLTKTFTGILLADLIQKNTVAYDNPVQMYVPNGTTVPQFAGRKISLLDLATHTSGLPRDLPNATYPTPQSAVFDFLDHYTLTYKPGTKWVYSNLAFGILGDVLVKAAGGRSWAGMVQNVINRPLGLVDTVVEPSQAQLSRRANGYDASGNPASFVMNGSPAINPAGALYSTTDDMLIYLNFNMGMAAGPLNSLLPDMHKSWRPVTGSSNSYTGLGWQITEGRNRTVWKIGTMKGFSSFIGFCTEKKVGVVVLSNSLQLDSSKLGNDLLNYLMADSIRLPSIF